MTFTDILTRLDYNDLNLYGRLSTKDLAEFSSAIPWLFPQYISSSPDAREHRVLIEMFNDVCNPGWNSLKEHPELQLKLLSLVGLGRKTQHTLYKPRKARKASNLVAFLRNAYPDIRSHEIDLFCRDTDVDTLVDMLYDWGVPVEDHSVIIKQFEEARGH